MSDLADEAKKIAAAAAGLRPDQIASAVEEYRAAVSTLHEEPQWQAIFHMCFSNGGGISQYHDPAGETKVTLEISGASRIYAIRGKAYETYGEARTAELLATTRPKPRVVES